MDDTQASLKATEASAATRKRRSSILKSQRPPRTPFSELEFNVATPTDTTKSRRVSFSRRTGVAEFVTNEATTTWKNFYEEHNKSLESSGNESAANARPAIGHIGKRIFDQLFEDVEVVDIGGTLQTNTAVQEFQSSFNNINLTQQLAAFECSADDKKLAAPNRNFDLSALTDPHSKVFGDELSIPAMTEMSNPISMNFSNVQPIGSNSKCDDLEEIQRDLERSNPSNVICPGPFTAGRDMSEYIEIDLNMTNVGARNDDCDMSITDTIHSPKVQEVVKNSAIEKKLGVNDDWVVDKENIVINPYAQPKESINFAINEASDEVLVFDGKKLTVQSEKKSIVLDSVNVPKTVPINTDVTPKRKTIVLNTNDDLPNFIPDTSSLIANQSYNARPKDTELKQSVIYNDFDLSITQAVDNRIDVPKRKTIVVEKDTGDVSITQAVPAKVIIDKQEMKNTILYESDVRNLSMTQAVPTNIISNRNVVEKRRTIVYENDDVSFTRALPANVILNENPKPSQDKTVYFQDGFDISVTQAIPENIITSNSDNISVKNDFTNLSITQAVPTNIISNETKMGKTVIYDNNADIDTTDIVSENVILPNKNNSDKRRTIVYEQDAANISVTQAIPSNIIFGIKNENHTNDQNKSRESMKENNRKNETIICNDEAEVSFTKVLPTNIIKYEEQKVMEKTFHNDLSITCNTHTNRDDMHKTANKNDVTISNNKDISRNLSNILQESNFCDDLGELSMTKPIPVRILTTVNDNKDASKVTNKSVKDKKESLINDSRNILQTYEDVNDMDVSDNDISMTRALPTNILTADELKNQENNKSLANINKTINKEVSINAIGNISKILQASKLYNNDSCNLSMTKPIPSDILAIQNELSDKRNEISRSETVLKDNNASINQEILVYQIAEQNKTKAYELDDSRERAEDAEDCSNISVDPNFSYSFNKTLAKDSNTKSVASIKNETNEVKKIERDSLNEMEITSIGTNKSAVNNEHTLKPKKSILNELLDMSCASSEESEDVAPNNVTINKNEINKPTENNKSTFEQISNDSIFFIKDSESNVNNEKDNGNCTKEDLETSNKSPKIMNKTESLDNKDESKQDMCLQQKVEELRSVSEDNRKSINRHYEKVLSSDLRKSVDTFNKSNLKNDHNISNARKTFKNADDTKELLEMLSDFTDSQAESQERNKTVVGTEEKNPASENKCEPTRFSIIQKRQSIALSREDLLTNISMAQAALQQSRFEIDESGSIEDTQDSPEDDEDMNVTKQSPKKSVRMSTDVVKTLQFEEDSVTDVSMTADVDMSPLKKTTFGEVSYMREDKARVIPTYLKDVSDGIKALMHDLVKPMADVKYNDTELSKSKRSPSTCSTQIQANLITSSQIDIDVELQSAPDSATYVDSKQSIVTEVATLGNEAVSHALRKSVKPVSSHVSVEIEEKPTMETRIKVSIARQSVPSPVILFDHNNPLNNILLTQSDCVKVHKYNPLSNDEGTVSESAQLDERKTVQKMEAENISLQYNVESQISRHQSMLQSGDARDDKSCASNSIDSNISKPLSIDRSTEGFVTEVKDTEVNTLIAMKANQDLLESNSSLTLVDDALAQDLDVKVESDSSNGVEKSPLRVIYKMDTDDEELHKMDSDFTSNDDFENLNENPANTRKRSYSPTKQDKQRLSRQNVEVTPKPLSKMQKISNSPQTTRNKDLNVPKIEPIAIEKSPNRSKSSPDKKKSPKRRSSIKKEDITVQQLITECYRDSTDRKIDKNILQVLKDIPSETLDTETLSRTIDCVSSAGTVAAGGGEARGAAGGGASRADWLPGAVDELSSKNLLVECSSSANVVARIDTLPFMGSRDCEWESSGGDVWMFRLLRTHVRLTVRLAHSHHNASRSRVRADTALVAVTVEPVQEEKDPLVALCVRLASEAMRHEGAGCARAGDVPALLRRCAAVARVALQWARAMRDARLRLACSVAPDGEITLKVANVALRAVWEVRLGVELAGAGREGAWPRACGVRARALLAGAPPATPRLARLVQRVPEDWGHVPAVLWKVFRYLKNKTTEDDLFGL